MAATAISGTASRVDRPARVPKVGIDLAKQQRLRVQKEIVDEDAADTEHQELDGPALLWTRVAVELLEENQADEGDCEQCDDPNGKSVCKPNATETPYNSASIQSAANRVHDRAETSPGSGRRRAAASASRLNHAPPRNTSSRKVRLE